MITPNQTLKYVSGHIFNKKFISRHSKLPYKYWSQYRYYLIKLIIMPFAHIKGNLAIHKIMPLISCTTSALDT